MDQPSQNNDSRSQEKKECDALFVISSLGGGGAERQVAILASGLADQGHSVGVLTMRSRTPEEYEIHPDILRMQLPDAMQKHMSKSRYESRALFNRIRKFIIKIRCIRQQIRCLEPAQIISIGYPEGLFAMALKPRGSVQTIWTMLSTKSPKSKHLSCRLLFGLARIRKTKTITQTKEIEREYREQGFTNLRTIPNPVLVPPEKKFDPSNRTPFRIIAVGRLVAQKSYEQMLDALAILEKNRSDWTCKIVGEGPLLDDLRSQARDLGIESKVEFAGWSRDVRSLLNDSDMYLITSSVEGQPNSLLEAMSESLPSVSTAFDGGAADDLLKNTSAGLVVPVGDTSGIAAAIETLMLNPELRKEMGTRARQVMEPLSIEKVTEC